MKFFKWFILTKERAKIIANTAEKLGWNNGLKEGYKHGHTRGYKEGYETGRLYERNPELFNMNYFTYLREIGYYNGSVNNITKLKTDIPQIFKEAFNE